MITLMNSFIDIYCERLGPGLWAEPINALTNLSFFIAGILLIFLARREGGLEWKSGLLIGLIFVIGAGSTLFHTFATFWAMLSDTLPILAFQICFIVLYSRFVMRWSCWKSGVLLALFFVAMGLAMNLPRHWLNGSLEYAPAFLFVFGLGLYHWRFALRERFTLSLAAFIFALSVSFRSIDMAICPTFPLGTHFLWHCLNGAVLYFSARAFILNWR